MSERGREVLEALRRIGVWSYRKRRELAGILLHSNPSHLYRVYLGGFLLYALNLSVEEATVFIERYSAWLDFDRRITERNLRGIHKRKHNGSKRSSFGPKGSSNGPKTGVEAFGTEMWIGRCATNGYPLEWHRVYLLG